WCRLLAARRSVAAALAPRMRSPRSVLCGLYFSPIGLSQISDVCVLAQLQRANIGNHLPAIFRRQLIGITRHRAEAIGDDIVKMAGRRFAQAILMIGRRVAESAQRDHSVSIAELSMTGQTGDIKAALAPVENLLRYFERKPILANRDRPGVG